MSSQETIVQNQNPSTTSFIKIRRMNSGRTLSTRSTMTSFSSLEISSPSINNNNADAYMRKRNEKNMNNSKINQSQDSQISCLEDSQQQHQQQNQNQKQKHSQKSSSSTTVEFAALRNIELISIDDFVVDQCLGSGAFADVFSIHSINNNKGGRKEGGDSALCDDKSDQYALKCLNRDTLRSARKTRTASADIMTEVKLLSSIPYHENIIQLHAISDDFFDCPSDGFFILDRLTDTLSHRLTVWRQQLLEQKASAPNKLKMMMKSATDRQQLMQQTLDHGTQQHQRLEHVGVGLAKALQFIHEHNIIYRDLKVDNIGFDVHDNVRLFDFGLSKKVELDDNGEPSKLHTKFVGTPRYMAYEVASSKCYGFSVDVYSYCVLLWEVLTLQKPYGQPKSLKHLLKMVEQGERPSLRYVSNRSVKTLLDDGWNHYPSIRPTMSEIIENLTTTLQEQKIKEQGETKRNPCSGHASAA